MNILRTYRLNRLIQRLCGMREAVWHMATDEGNGIKEEDRPGLILRGWWYNRWANRIDNLKNRIK